MAVSEEPVGFQYSGRRARCSSPCTNSSSRALSASFGSNKDFSMEMGHDRLHSKRSVPTSVEDSRYLPRLDSEGRHQAKYGSTLTNIGVEYMKATGTIGVRFQQLQKPSMSQSHDSIACHRHSERRNSAGVSNLIAEIPLIIPTNKHNPESGKVVYKAPTNPHHHAGYRLGQRKALAERRRKIADYSCIFALIGIGLMVLEMECTIGGLYGKVKY